MSTAIRQELAGVFDDLCRDYYHEEICELAQHYPNEQQSLYVEAKDLYRLGPDILDFFIANPGDGRDYLEEAVANHDIPADVDLSDVNVRVTDSNGYLNRKGVGELYSNDETNYVALRGRIGQVTGAMTKLEIAAFNCQKCPETIRIPQPDTSFEEPYQCPKCDNQTFQIDFAESQRVDQKKLKIEQPPHEQTNGSGEEIVAYAYDDLIHVGGENGLQDKAGEVCTILGEYRPDTTDLEGRGNVTPTYDCYFVAHAFVFDDADDDDFEPEAYREEVEEFANRPDAIDIFRQSIDPGLTIVNRWEHATYMATAYAFGAPRIDPDDGDMVRGDLHMLFVSDPGMRKSVFADKLAEILPDCEIRQATGMASDVGLTAAAQRDEFGDGQWTLSPGALPRANGGHLILDEIDKGPDDGLGGIHDALEGSQQLKIDKAGIQATMATRVGFMALGNPVDGRFDQYEPVAEQIDLDPALMSRFDLIVTMSDDVDEDMDTEIAEGVLDSIDESARIEYGDMEADEADSITPDVPRDVMRAWVALARKEIQPLLTEDAKEELSEFYVDTRQLNDEDSEATPITARKLLAGVRISMAFARCELSETVEKHHAKQAVEVSKAVISENFDPETGEFDSNRTTETPSSQEERVSAIQQAIQGEQKEVIEIVEETGIAESTVKHRLDKLSEKGLVIEPTHGEYRWIGE